MEIILHKENLSGYDTGGGTREVRATITIDATLHPRSQRFAAIHGTLGCCLGYILTHEQLDDIANKLLDVWDQLEPI